ncbi:MAG TPA: nitroreductase family deazaflavin-dependent oxidoreductase [Solirubrobacteraceae bacterium]|nr:nitroreductase family deazaflavin-dependent oxidoreductase [Solirubrobacteraceae bacterium]
MADEDDVARRMSEFNRRIIEEFRGNAGRVGPPFEGAPMVLLTTTGARTGARRTVPLVCLEDDDGTLYVFASKAGAPANPAWYHNLLAHPRVTVEHGTERFEAVATPLEGAQRDEAFARQVALRPQFGEYQKSTSRTIPVIALRRA